jgi:hypothetical protein
MNEHSNPIEFLIDFAWANGADRFVVNNAKDELNKLRTDISKLLDIFNHPIAYGKINERLDLYDLRLMNNPHEDQTKIVALYSNRDEFLKGDWKGYANYGKHSK